MSNKDPHWGTTLDTFLTEDSIRETGKAEAVMRVVAWQQRAQVDHILKAKGNRSGLKDGRGE